MTIGYVLAKRLKARSDGSVQPILPQSGVAPASVGDVAWRIRCKDIAFGLRFSDGGDSPLFVGESDAVKSPTALWTDEGQLKAHITRVLKRNPKVYMRAEVVRYALVEDGVEDLEPRAFGASL